MACWAERRPYAVRDHVPTAYPVLAQQVAYFKKCNSREIIMRANKLIGVWIDSKKAVISTLYEDDATLAVLESGIEGNERIEGEGRPEGRFGGQFLNNEQAEEARRQDAEREFVEKVVERVRDADQLLIFGPSQMKGQVEKAVRSLPAPAPNIRAVENADTMTDNQVAEYVRNYFGRPAPRL